MKEYILQVTIREGSDEFWENLADHTGCDEVLNEVGSVLFDAGIIHDREQVRLLRFTHEEEAMQNEPKEDLKDAQQWAENDYNTGLAWEANICAGLSAVINRTTRNTVTSYMRPEYAKLMAAAPELLAVALRFVDIYASGGPESALDHLDDLAHAAIEKALGPSLIQGMIRLQS